MFTFAFTQVTKQGTLNKSVHEPYDFQF